MKIKIHPVDLTDIMKLKEAKEQIEGAVDSGRLTKGDVSMSWPQCNNHIVISGKDIKEVK